MEIHNPLINTPSPGFFAKLLGISVPQDSHGHVEGLQLTARKMVTFLSSYISSQQSAMESDTKNITAKDLRLKCIIFIWRGLD